MLVVVLLLMVVMMKVRDGSHRQCAWRIPTAMMAHGRFEPSCHGDDSVLPSCDVARTALFRGRDVCCERPSPEVSWSDAIALTLMIIAYSDTTHYELLIAF